MPNTKTLRDHEILVRRMARTLGTDLDEAELRGDLAPESRDAMVLACTGCTSPEACGKWLDSHDSAERPPSYCRNADILADLTRRD